MPINKNFYDEKTIKDYKARLAAALVKDGLSADTIATSTMYKEYLIRFAEDNIIAPQAKDRIMGITYKMAVMDLDILGTGATEYQSFPIINKFKGHNLIESIYFRKDGTGVSTASVPIRQALTIIS